MDYGSFTETKRKLQTGDPRTVPLKVVCSSCNGVWMSQLQEDNKPLISRIGAEDAVEPTVDEQVGLSRWAIMTALVIGSKHPHLIFVNAENRASFAKGNDITPGWAVWIGRFSGIHWHSFNHFGVRFGERSYFPDGSIATDLTSFGMQSTAWVTAGVFFLVAYKNPIANLLNVETREMRYDVPLLRIHPATENGVLPEAIGDYEADVISRIPLDVPEEISRRQWQG
jgi:hypothetical protein